MGTNQLRTRRYSTANNKYSTYSTEHSARWGKGKAAAEGAESNNDLKQIAFYSAESEFLCCRF